MSLPPAVISELWLGGHTGTVLNLLNAITSEIWLPLLGRVCTPADAFVAEGAWGRKKTLALPAACPGSARELGWGLATAQQCGGHLPKGMPRYLLLGQQSPGSACACPVPAPGWGQITPCAGCHLALLQTWHSSMDREGFQPECWFCVKSAEQHNINLSRWIQS